MGGIQKSFIRIPEYSKRAAAQGLDDIGPNYVEVDMEHQRLYYIEDEVVKFETDIVTGNEMRKMSTPQMICTVYGKQKNRVLRGPGYASPVKYWMPIYRGIGLHDANWRSEFGGEIYKTNGSHGCINIPSDRMEELYNMVEVGTPVILYTSSG